MIEVVVELIGAVVEGRTRGSLTLFFLLSQRWRGGEEVCLVQTIDDVGFEVGAAGLELVPAAEHGYE